MHPQMDSPLFGLPQELRDKIYGYVFEMGLIHVNRSRCPKRSGGIMMACYQTYQETIGLYYKHTVFSFDGVGGPSNIDNIDHMFTWLKSLPNKHRNLVHKVEVSVNWSLVVEVTFPEGKVKHFGSFETCCCQDAVTRSMLQHAGIEMQSCVLSIIHRGLPKSEFSNRNSYRSSQH
ncbi:hypothetical protein LTR37_003262 [Vermiconidia calcicola]|uniref:Uncharacterized protein n=1 Tax=Vermiconidia calcicola TaxID=1690605 RepID=A0ACC3NR06_9PEZI|nr:hypothetical protein LTR37_003262 [Vermiconidia calcicola]